MPNYEMHHCGLSCCHFDNGRNICRLRCVFIELPLWTTCKSFNRPGSIAEGPLYAIVSEVKNNTGQYCDIPYFNGCRADTAQRKGQGDTVVCFTNQEGRVHEFASVADYMAFYHQNNHYLVKLHLDISRNLARKLGEETVDILQSGFYVAASGKRVDIADAVEEAVCGTVTYPPDCELPERTARSGRTAIEVRNETTLRAVESLQAQGFEPAALNFASSNSPGGGFLSGARAQEEYLARSSALWACLKDNEMYPYHNARLDPFYSDWVIYSPNVPILRNDAGELLESPYPCSILTSPAVHAHGVRRYRPECERDIAPIMWRRILKVLSVAEKHGHAALVLGAWGCGAFGNEGHEIAGLFRRALEDNFQGSFERVMFAVTDWSEDERYIGPFRHELGGGSVHYYLNP